jgi:hypothetical protein
MKNFGISLFDITNLEGALRISLFGLWVEKTRLKDSRSLLAIEVDKTDITVDVAFMRFLFKR